MKINGKFTKYGILGVSLFLVGIFASNARNKYLLYELQLNGKIGIGIVIEPPECQTRRHRVHFTMNVNGKQVKHVIPKNLCSEFPLNKIVKFKTDEKQSRIVFEDENPYLEMWLALSLSIFFALCFFVFKRKLV